MKAIILIGGLGTRLRPVTYSTPKSLLPVANVPFIGRSLSWFVRHGVREFVLALSNQAGPIIEYVNSLRASLRIDVEFRVESVPLGSGGALLNCADLVKESCIVYNGDILTDLDIGSLVSFHRQKRASISATFNEVDDPTHYGVPEMDADHRVLGWQEKPSRETARSRFGNVGVWVVEPEVLSYIPANETVSLEKDTFPLLLRDDVPFFGYCFEGYWKDIGTIDKYVDANRDILLGRVRDHEIGGQHMGDGVWVDNGVRLPNDCAMHGPILIGAGTTIGEGVSITGPTVIGRDCVIDAATSIAASVVWDNARIGRGSQIEGAVVGSSEIGADSFIGRGAVIASDSRLAAGSYVPPFSLLGPGSSLAIGRS